jgi:hypothetical protein
MKPGMAKSGPKPCKTSGILSRKVVVSEELLQSTSNGRLWRKQNSSLDVHHVGSRPQKPQLMIGSSKWCEDVDKKGRKRIQKDGRQPAYKTKQPNKTANETGRPVADKHKKCRSRYRTGHNFSLPYRIEVIQSAAGTQETAKQTA